MRLRLLSAAMFAAVALAGCSKEEPSAPEPRTGPFWAVHLAQLQISIVYLASGGSKLDTRLDWAFQRALNRTPDKAERKVLTELHRKNLARFRAAPNETRELLGVGEAPVAGDAVEVAAMTTVARAILNLHETITRN